MIQNKVCIVDTTLREGEQFALAHFSSVQKLAIAQALDAFGVEYLELTSPVASPQSEADLRLIAALPLRAKVLTHTRCYLPDVERAVACGVRGVNLLWGTSAVLRQASHGRSIPQLIDEAIPVIRFLQASNVEVRFSCEDAFRTDPAELLQVYAAVSALGVDRVGIADTVGIATPREVAQLVGMVHATVGCPIEFHGHNDGGCAVANAHAALEAGATLIDTTVLGIGERNGIAALGGLIARLYLSDPQTVAHYRLACLPELDELVAQMLGIAIPFNSCITSGTAFTHKAGLHTNAVLRNSHTYEALDPSTFGRTRTVLIGHRLTGRHAVAQRAQELGIELDRATLGWVTQELKCLADERNLEDAEVDALIKQAASLDLSSELHSAVHLSDPHLQLHSMTVGRSPE